MYETKFVTLATNESDWHHNTDESYARVCVSGAIGLLPPEDSESREEFINKGMRFLDTFQNTADLAIDEEEQNDEPSQAIIRAIKRLAAEALLVNREDYAEELGIDWDERFQ